MAGCVCLVLRSDGVVGSTYTDTADTADKSTGASLSDSSPPISFSLVLCLSDSGSLRLCDVESLQIFPAFGVFLSSNFKAPGELACASFAFACSCGSHPLCLWMLAGTGAGLKCISDEVAESYSMFLGKGLAPAVRNSVFIKVSTSSHFPYISVTVSAADAATEAEAAAKFSDLLACSSSVVASLNGSNAAVFPGKSDWREC